MYRFWPIVESTRQKRQIGIRLFKDDLEELEHIRVNVFRGRCTIAQLIRTAIEDYIAYHNDRSRQLRAR